MNKRLSFPLAVIISCAACGPIGPMPGLNIGGEEQPTPNDFAFVQNHELITVRTLLGGWLPQVHNIWGVGVGDAVYALAAPDASWRARLHDDPDVLLRVGDGYYRLTASTVSDAAETQSAFDAYMDKYGPQLEELIGHPPTLEDVSDLVRFDARRPS